MYSYLSHKNHIETCPTNATALFGRLQAVKMSLCGGAVRALRINKGDVDDFKGKIKDVAGHYFLPDYLQSPSQAASLAKAVITNFRNSPLAEAGRLSALSREHFDQLLFASAATEFRTHAKAQAQTALLLAQPLDLSLLPQKNTLASTYGVESEFFGMQDETSLKRTINLHDKTWLLTDDASIKADDYTEGKELVSPILTDPNIHRLYLYTDYLKTQKIKAAAEQKCALHVHVGLHNIQDENLRENLKRQMVINYAAIEDDLDFLDNDMTHPYRYVNRKTHRIEEKQGPRLDFMNAVATRTEDIMPNPYYDADDSLIQPFGRRHSRINFSCFYKYGTAEFRHHPGTTSPRDILAWVGFVNDFMNVTMHMAKTQPVHIPNGAELQVLKDQVTKFKQKRETPAIKTYTATGPGYCQANDDFDLW